MNAQQQVKTQNSKVKSEQCPKQAGFGSRIGSNMVFVSSRIFRLGFKSLVRRYFDRKLLAYRHSPSQEKAYELEMEFWTLFTEKTGYEQLDERRRLNTLLKTHK